MVTRAASLQANPRPIDPDVKVPEAVKRAAAAAEAAQRQAYPGQNPEPVSTPAPTNPDTIKIADAPAQPQPPVVVTPQGNEPPVPQPPAVTPQPEPAPAPTQWAPEVELEFHRIRSAEGRKRAAIEAQLLQATDRMAALENMVSELQARVNAPAPAPTPAPAPAKLITEQEAAEFGPEMLDVMGRRTMEVVSPLLTELRTMMQGIEQKVDGTVKTVVQTGRAAMLSKLDSTLPEWRTINKMQEFKAWLALPDPYFGATRQSALLKAYEQNDTARVLNFFNGFVSEQAASDPAYATVEPSPAPQPAKPTLDSLAAPGRARMSAQPNAPAEKQIITTADVNAFYDAVRRGMYVGREAEKQALEQELFQAQREGRVRAA